MEDGLSCLTNTQERGSAVDLRRERKPDLVSRLAQAQHETQRLSAALQEEKRRADVAEARADKLDEMYSRLKHKYTSLKRSIREISGANDNNLLLKCDASPEPDAEARVGKSQRTGGACASRATPSPPADDLVTPVCRDERATPSPLLDDGATPECEHAALRPAQPPAPRVARTCPEPTVSVERESFVVEATVHPEMPQATSEPPAQGEPRADTTDEAAETGGTDAAAGEDETTQLAVTLSNGAGQLATNVPAAEPEDDAEAASLALAMQLMQQEQALAQIYSGDQVLGYGFGVEQEEDAGGEDWIPADEIEEVEVAEDALDEGEATYEQLLELDEQKVVVGLSDRAKAGATKVLTLSESDVAAFETLHDKRCCICLCDYEAGDEVRQLPCKHGCHLDCMDQHLAQSKTCPMCRTEVVTPRSSPTPGDGLDVPTEAPQA